MSGDHNKMHYLLTEKIKQKHKVCGISKVVMFDSFNGANYLEIVEGKFDLVSF